MNMKRWAVASIVAAVAIILLDSGFHGVLLRDAYLATATLWRPEAEMAKLLPLGWAATILMTFVLVYIYHRGYEGKVNGFVEGLRFGFWIGLFMGAPAALWSYVIIPMPINLAVSWFVISMVDLLIAGGLIGLIYKPKPVA